MAAIRAFGSPGPALARALGEEGPPEADARLDQTRARTCVFRRGPHARRPAVSPTTRLVDEWVVSNKEPIVEGEVVG